MIVQIKATVRGFRMPRYKNRAWQPPRTSMLYVIMGAPCSGKSTYVLERARDGDIVIDLDRIAVAITGVDSDSHAHHPLVKDSALVARKSIISKILESKSYQLTDVYIIDSIPTWNNMSRYKSHHAEIIKIDPGRDVVESRIRKERPESTLETLGKFYAG